MNENLIFSAKSHKCHVCDFSTSYPEKLRRHIKAHVNRGEISAAEMIPPAKFSMGGNLIVSPGSSASDSMAMLMISPAISEPIDRRSSLQLELGEIVPPASMTEGDESSQGGAEKSGASTPISSSQNPLLQSNWLQQMAWYQQLMASQLGAGATPTDSGTHKVLFGFFFLKNFHVFFFLWN